MSDCDVLVVGAGPGGYVCALRAAQLGLRVVIVDPGPVGGTCLNIGCIPSKAIIHAADTFAASAGDPRLGIATAGATIDLAATMAWKDGVVHRLTSGVATLLHHGGVRRVEGRAEIIDGKTVRIVGSPAEQVLRTTHLVLATGSQPVELPALPFGGRVLSSTEALALTTVPGRLVVVGAGYIGLELGTAFRKLGAAVTVVEIQPRILPQYDDALTRPVAARLRSLGVELLLGATAHGLDETGAALSVTDASGQTRSLAADAVLVTVGRRPLTAGWNLESLDLAMDGRSIRIDDRCRTSMHDVFAIGDLTGEPMLAHRAMAQGAMVAEIIAGEARAWDGRVVAEVCFTDPEIVKVGMSPEEATGAGIEHVVGRFPLGANGRALTLDRSDGFVRLVARRDDHLVLGLQAVGAMVSELATSFAMTLEMGAVLEDIAATTHAHPSLGEAVHEAALAALGRGLHRV
ncbi:MAG: Dihydrolipoyl dehydrogenase [Ilumatobacteraceae bacterium]|nr:Dihydrolipoyl dehydrogenase [Ilumatobacteraceae bacterium]